MSKMFIVCILFAFFNGCTSYIEKNSETLSQSVYATQDSATKGRYDLVDYFANESVKLVPPPKKPIVIKPFDTNE